MTWPEWLSHIAARDLPRPPVPAVIKSEEPPSILPRCPQPLRTLLINQKPFVRLFRGPSVEPEVIAACGLQSFVAKDFFDVSHRAAIEQ